MSGDRANTKSASKSRKDQARYTNFFQIGHNAFEFLLEFGQQENIHTRVYLSPQHAQILSDLLLDTLQQHKELFNKPQSGREKPH